MQKNSVIGLFLLLTLTACTPYMYGVPQENWDRMSESERIEGMRVYERNEYARRQAAEEQSRIQAYEEQARRQAAEERIRHEAREREKAQAAEERFRHEAREREQARLAEERFRHEAREREQARLAEERARHEAREREKIQIAEERARHEAREREKVQAHERERHDKTREPEAPTGRDKRHPASTASTSPFVSGKTLRWETDAQGGQNGTIYVTSSDGYSFYLDQKNNKNKAAGITKLEGKIENGKVVIKNSQWKETWVGTLKNGTISGKINNKNTFKITE